MVIDKKYENLISDYPKPDLKKKTKIPLSLRFLQLGFKYFGSFFPEKAAAYAFKLFTTPKGNAIHKHSDPILESAKVFEFMFGKYLLKAYEWGSGEKTILLVHGWGSRGTALRSFVPGLVDQGYRVITFDGPAHGNSPGKRTTLSQYSNSIKAIINHLNGVEGIIAHSFGGPSTVFALKDMTDNNSIARLVLVAAPSRMEYMIDNFLNFIKAPTSVAFKFVEILESKVGIPLEKAQTSKFYPQLKIGQTLIIHDVVDNVVPFEEAKAVLKEWDNTSLVATNGYGHYHILKNPNVVNRVVSFISSY